MTAPTAVARSDRTDSTLLTVTVHDDGDRWDRFVRDDPHGTFCHRWVWRDIMRDVLRHESRYVVAAGLDGEWHGVLPLVEVDSQIFGHYLVSMPFLNYGGPLGTPVARRHLAVWAEDHAMRRGVDLMELRSREVIPDLTARRSYRKVTVVLDLPTHAEALWEEAFSSKLRSQIRRPQKAGCSVRFGAAEVDAFYSVFARHMRDLGTPVLPRALFHDIAEALGDEVVFATVRENGQAIAGGCGFVWGDEFEMTWAASLVERKRLAPNMLLYWACMEESVNRGLRRFNFGRCTPGSGTHRFKQQWGGTDVSLPWIHWSASGVSATPAPDRPHYQAATAVWKRLPVAVTTRFGPILARQLP